MHDKEPDNAGLTRRQVITRGAIGVGALSLTGALAACGGGGSTTRSATGAVKGPQKAGGTLRVGMPSGGAGSSIDPDAGALVTGDVARFIQLYDTLLVRDENFNIVPHLAEEVSSNKAGTVWTIRLKDGIEFHDGTPLTSADVAYSLRRHAAPNSIDALYLANVDTKAIKLVDKLTVQVPMTQPQSLFETFLAGNPGYVVPQGYDPKNPVGTGPFKFVSFSPGQQTELARNDNYFDGKPFVEKLQLIEYSDDSARVNALLSNQVDAITDLPYSQLSVVESNPSTVPYNVRSPQALPFVMNQSVKPFDDERVRRAFRLIANRPQLVETALVGQGYVGNDIFAPFDPTYIGNELPQRHQDIEQARSLLKQAGQSDLTVQLTTSETAAGLVEASTVFAQQAKEAGVTINLKQIPPTQYFGEQWLSYAFGVEYFPVDYVTWAAVTYAPGSPFNETHHVDPEWAKLWNEVTREVNPTKRAHLLEEIQRIDYERGDYIVWGFSNWVDGVSAKTVGWPEGKYLFPLGNFQFRKVSFS